MRAPRGPLLPTLLLTVLALLAETTGAQEATGFDEVGLFYMQNLAPQDYGAHKQNWAVVQNARGFVYVGNNHGVLEYDGVSWRLLETTNGTLGRSLAAADDGRVYVGANAELGFLESAPPGPTRYVSLVDQIPTEDRDFIDVWTTQALSDGVYFQTRHQIFRWRDGKIEVWRSENGFHVGMAVHDTYFVTDHATGALYTMDGDVLRRAPGGADFEGKKIYALVPHGSNAFLAITRQHGIIRCRLDAPDAEACRPHAPELTALLAELEPYCAALLPGGILAIGTRESGLVLLDRDAHLFRVVDKTSGLLHDKVWDVSVDRQGGLWLALNDGLARIEATPVISYFDETTGLEEPHAGAMRHQGRLYIPSADGVRRLEKATGTVPRFVPVPGLDGFCWSLISTEEGLLAGCTGGVYHVDEGRRIWGLPQDDVFVMHRSRRDPHHLYLGLQDGLARLKFEDGAWHDAGRSETIQAQVRSLVEDDQGRLWIGTRAKGILRLEAGAAPFEPRAIRRFGPAEGLPGGWLDVHAVADQILVAATEVGGLYRHESRAEGERFVPDTDLFPQGSATIESLAEDDQGRIWLALGDDSGVAVPTAGGGFAFEPTLLRREAKLDAFGLFAESGGPLWITTTRKLIRLETAIGAITETSFPVWIRDISSPGGNRRHEGLETTPTWPHTKTAMRFSFAAPRYDAPERTRYRTRLDGFDDAWSDWSRESHKDYTNLWEGRYTFRVQAMDVYGMLSREDRLTFRVLPPWYRTGWAFGLYGLALLLLVRAWIRSHREELRRERAAAQREREVSRRLREVDKLKDQFLANTSHELRTPLYGIIGLAEAMADTDTELPPSFRDQLATIAASGHRLQRLVGDILDFSKLEQDRLDLVRQPLALAAVVHSVLELLRPLAAGKQLALVQSIPDDLPAVYAD